MTNLPTGPLLGLFALALLWSVLLGGIEAAHQYLSVRRPKSRAGDRPTLDFPLQSLILGNLLCKVLAIISAIVLAQREWGEPGIWLGGACALLILLVFADYLPRLLARRQPQAFISLGNGLLTLPLKGLYPLAWLLEGSARLLLRPFTTRPTIVARQEDEEPSEPAPDKPEHGGRHPKPHLLSGIQALERITVNDILVTRSEVDGINLNDSIEDITHQLIVSRHTRLPVFHSDINQVESVLNTRQISHLLPNGQLTREALLAACHPAYFVPESTPLPLQLLNFHKQQRRLAVVVDEYGEVQGIITLEDILEEIVGEFEEEHELDNPHIHPQADGRFVIEGAASLRELNKSLGWHLPSDGPKTLNGLITEALETIPESAVCLKIGRYRLEILETEDNRVSRVMAWAVTRSR